MENAILPRATLVLGGARSGKSTWAEHLRLGHDLERIYLATAEARDDEMAERIAKHQERRGNAWRAEEVPLELPRALDEMAGPGRAVLVDCLTLWLSNLMAAERDIEEESAALVAAIERARGPVVLVSNEVGLGIVPMNALARAFRDHAGRLNQITAAAADQVVFLAAGLPMVLKAPAA